MTTRNIEVDNTYFDEDANYYTIDVWENGNDEGHIAAVINGTTGDVWFIDNTLRHNEQVLESIAEVQREIKKYKLMKVGTSVLWNDPAIKDYPKDEQEAALAREFVITDICLENDDEIIPNTNTRIVVTDGVTEVEGFAIEFTPMTFAVICNGEEICECHTRKDVEACIKDFEAGDRIFDRERTYEIKRNIYTA